MLGLGLGGIQADWRSGGDSRIDGLLAAGCWCSGAPRRAGGLTGVLPTLARPRRGRAWELQACGPARLPDVGVWTPLAGWWSCRGSFDVGGALSRTIGPRSRWIQAGGPARLL